MLRGYKMFTTDSFMIGDWLREKRKAAGLGLRKFAILIGDLPSNVCNIENGRRKAWQNEEKLRKVASVLGFQEYDEDWDTLFGMARRPNQPPADIAASFEKNEYLPTLMRTIQERQLTEEEIKKVINYVEKNFRKGRGNAKHRR